MFLSLKYRKDLNDKQRDPVLNAAALALSLYGVTTITYLITGINFMNPVIALVQITSAASFIP